MSPRERVDVDVAVIGAGVVGLAVARALALAGRGVAVLEAEAGPGRGASARNSGVLHAGLHHPPGWLKSSLCVEGRRLLVEYCAARGVPHARTGKIVVATAPDEVPALEAMAARGRVAGVNDLLLLDAADVAALEPSVRAVRGLLSPSTGIVDPEALVRALARDAADAGAIVVYGAPVVGGAGAPRGLVLEVGGATPFTVRCRAAVNAAGLGAQAVARAIRGVAPASIPPLHLAKGSWFVLRGKAPFRRLVYPVPVEGGLGTHLTLDLAGAARFGPDVEWVEAPGALAVDPGRAPAFEAAVRRFWPGLPPGALAPGFAGIRPKLSGPGEPARDFELSDASAHGVPGLVCLYGIESPGLTACLAIAARVRKLLGVR
ncbi:MAG: NAD(P)/FAD-dependent oxidoreductase [Anaeromyxobacteraceae bacterium]